MLWGQGCNYWFVFIKKTLLKHRLQVRHPSEHFMCANSLHPCSKPRRSYLLPRCKGKLRHRRVRKVAWSPKMRELVELDLNAGYPACAFTAALCSHAVGRWEGEGPSQGWDKAAGEPPAEERRVLIYSFRKLWRVYMHFSLCLWVYARVSLRSVPS